MDNYKKQCPIDGGTCGQGGTCFVCENESLGAELAAAKARIAELERQCDGHIQAFHMATDNQQWQRDRIAALEKALEATEPMLRKVADGNKPSFAENAHIHSWAQHLAALLKEKE